MVVGFLIVSLVGALIDALGIRSLSQVNNMAESMYVNETVGIGYAAVAQREMITIGRVFRSTFLASSAVERMDAVEQIKAHFISLKQSLKEARPSFATAQEQQELDKLVTAVEVYEQNMAAVLAQIHLEPYYPESELVNEIVERVVPAGDTVESLMRGVIDAKDARADQYNEQIAQVYVKIRNVLIVFTILGALFGLLLGVVITRVIKGQLGAEPNEVNEVANNIAQGKLQNHINTGSLAEGSVMHAMGVMQNSLRRIVNEVRLGSHSIATGTSQIVAGNMDLSQRTEEQSANVTETASAIEEIASSLRNQVEAAQEAINLALVVRNSATEGQRAVTEVVTTMGEMQDFSEQIVTIINVIDSIAFQTNILALNAAVEAARAGTEGRGFAVVASEVRALAQRSAAAAQDIKNLIQESVDKVQSGNQEVNVAGGAIEAMVKQVNQVTTLIDEISASILEQNTGVIQVNQAVGQLEEATQQNAALVEQSAVAAASLNDQAERLVDLVSVFDLGDSAPVLDNYPMQPGQPYPQLN